MTRLRHERPHEVNLETARHEDLAEEIRYLRELIRRVGKRVRGLEPELLEAWKAEVRENRHGSGYEEE